MGCESRFGAIEADLSFWADRPFDRYLPRFSIEESGSDVVWITDHGRRVALIYKPHYQIELIEFDPSRPRFARAEIPEVYHAPSLLGVKLTMAQWINQMQQCSSDAWTLEIQARHDKVIISVRESWRQWRMESVKTFELRVHSRFGYVLGTTNSICGGASVLIEFANVLAAGLADHRPEKIRFPFVVWRNPRQGLLRWISNHASIRCFGQIDTVGARNLGTDGWLGFLGERDWNPVFALRSASQPCASITCDNLLDEHLHFQEASSLDASGNYRWKSEGALFSLPGHVAERLVADSKPNDLATELAYPERIGKDWSANYPVDPSLPRNPKLCAFMMNRVSDFENALPLTSYYRGQFWPAQLCVEGWVSITTAKAHSGKCSLRLCPGRGEGEKEIHPIGASMWLRSGRDYRLSA